MLVHEHFVEKKSKRMFFARSMPWSMLSPGLQNVLTLLILGSFVLTFGLFLHAYISSSPKSCGYETTLPEFFGLPLSSSRKRMFCIVSMNWSVPPPLAIVADFRSLDNANKVMEAFLTLCARGACTSKTLLDSYVCCGFCRAGRRCSSLVARIDACCNRRHGCRSGNTL